MSRKPNDIDVGWSKRITAGQQFNRLKTVSFCRIGARNPAWLCECVCGGEIKVIEGHLIHGVVKRCGCYQREKSRSVCLSRTIHGMVGTPIYRVWMGMRHRCKNPNCAGWKWYGGKGVKVYERWNDFKAFLSDMGERPYGTSIDRINSNGDYEPTNCRWATSKQQTRNTSRNRHIEAFGEKKSVVEWSEDPRCPVSRTTLMMRLDGLKWAPERAIVTPLRAKKGHG